MRYACDTDANGFRSDSRVVCERFATVSPFHHCPRSYLCRSYRCDSCETDCYSNATPLARLSSNVLDNRAMRLVTQPPMLLPSMMPEMVGSLANAAEVVALCWWPTIPLPGPLNFCVVYSVVAAQSAPWLSSIVAVNVVAAGAVDECHRNNRGWVRCRGRVADRMRLHRIQCMKPIWQCYGDGHGDQCSIERYQRYMN